MTTHPKKVPTLADDLRAAKARGYCCEVCWRNPWCGNDCGSCVTEDETSDRAIAKAEKSR